MIRISWLVGALGAVSLVGCGQLTEHVVGLTPFEGTTSAVSSEPNSTAVDSDESTTVFEDSTEEVAATSDAGSQPTDGASCVSNVTEARVLWTRTNEHAATCLVGACTGYAWDMKSDGAGGVWLLYAYVDTIVQRQGSLGLLHYDAGGQVVSDVLFAEEEVAASWTRRFDGRLSLDTSGKPVVVASTTVLDNSEDHVTEQEGVWAYFFDGNGEYKQSLALSDAEFSVTTEPIVVADGVLAVVLENAFTVKVVKFDSEQISGEHAWPEGAYSNIGMRGTSSLPSFGGTVGHNNEEAVDFFLTRVDTNGQFLWSAPTTTSNPTDVTLTPTGELVTATLGGPGWTLRGFDAGQEVWSVGVPFAWAVDGTMQNGSYVVPRVGGGFAMKGSWRLDPQERGTAGVVQLSPDRAQCTYSFIEGSSYLVMLESLAPNEVFVMDGDDYRFMKVAL